MARERRTLYEVIFVVRCVSRTSSSASVRDQTPDHNTQSFEGSERERLFESGNQVDIFEAFNITEGYRITRWLLNGLTYIVMQTDLSLFTKSHNNYSK